MVIQVDLPAAFAIGQVMGLLSKKYLKREPELFKSKLLGVFNFYLACGFVPGGLFLLVGWPAWEGMYSTAWTENPFDRPLVAGFYVLFMIAMMMLGNVGYILAHYWYKKGKDKWVVFGAVAGVFLTLLPFLVKWGVWWTVGTYGQVQANQGYSFFQPPFFYGWLAIMSYLFITGILTGLWFLKKGKELGARFE